MYIFNKFVPKHVLLASTQLSQHKHQGISVGKYFSPIESF